MTELKYTLEEIFQTEWTYSTYEMILNKMKEDGLLSFGMSKKDYKLAEEELKNKIIKRLDEIDDEIKELIDEARECKLIFKEGIIAKDEWEWV